MEHELADRVDGGGEPRVRLTRGHTGKRLPHGRAVPRVPVVDVDELFGDTIGLCHLDPPARAFSPDVAAPRDELRRGDPAPCAWRLAPRRPAS